MSGRNFEPKEQLSKCKKVMFSCMSICRSVHMNLLKLVDLGPSQLWPFPSTYMGAPVSSDLFT